MRAASREVRRLTKGLVTDGRARDVYRNRMVRDTGVNAPPGTPDTEQTEENQAVATEPDSVGDENKQSTQTCFKTAYTGFKGAYGVQSGH